MTSGYIFGLCFLYFVKLSSLQDTADVVEYCNHESVTADCGPEHVIVILKADYGRMNLGRCVRKDLGYVGCSVNVLAEMDRLCSGRHQCSFRIPDLDVEVADVARDPQCMEELKSYLEASHACIPVQTANAHQCQRTSNVILSSPTGFISSAIAEETGCGTGYTPWIIRRNPGQKINVTLLDFGTASNHVTVPSRDGGTSQVCHAYAIIRERELQESMTVCGGTTREQMVYMSRGHELEIRLFIRRRDGEGDGEEDNQSTQQHFLLKYEEVGCADMLVTHGLSFQRRVDDNVADIRCTTSDESWRVRCENKVWIGHVGNCSIGLGPQTGTMMLGGISIPVEISVVIITIIAAIISLFILIIGLVCVRRRQYRRPMVARGTAHVDQNTLKRHNKYAGHPMVDQYNRHHMQQPCTLPRDGNGQQHPIYPRSTSIPQQESTNEYACILDMPLPPAPPPGEAPAASYRGHPPAYSADQSSDPRMLPSTYNTGDNPEVYSPESHRYFELEGSIAPPAPPPSMGGGAAHQQRPPQQTENNIHAQREQHAAHYST